MSTALSISAAVSAIVLVTSLQGQPMTPSISTALTFQHAPPETVASPQEALRAALRSGVYPVPERDASRASENIYYYFGREVVDGGARRLFAVIYSDADGVAAHLGDRLRGADGDVFIELESGEDVLAFLRRVHDHVAA